MLRVWRLVSFMLFALAATARSAEHTGYPVTPASFETVTLTDEFWLPRLQTQRKGRNQLQRSGTR